MKPSRSSFLALLTAFVLATQLQTTRAAIVWSGDIVPDNPNTWTDSTNGYIGLTNDGSLLVNQRRLLSYKGVIARGSHTTCEVTVDGAGSKWTNSDVLNIGDRGAGTLNITAGGKLSNGGRSSIGVDSGSTGEVTVDGAGSSWINSGTSWTNSSRLAVGLFGSGTLNITNGGAVSVADDTWVSFGSTSTGTINFGANGGTLTTGEFYASSTQLKGTGTINTQGLVSDVDLVFDASHGLSQTLTLNDPGQNITLNLDLSGASSSPGSLGAGYRGSGTLAIRDGITVASQEGYIGFHSGSSGSVTVNGAGSSWTTDSDFVVVGNYGSGTLDITAGGAVSNRNGYIGHFPGSTGRVTVDGLDSTWTNSGALKIGSDGSGTLNITNGGVVSVADDTWVGSGSTSTGTIDFGVNGGTLTTGEFYASHMQLKGVGTINTRGLVSDVDLVFDASHGLSQTLTLNNPEHNITLNLDLSGASSSPGSLGVGYIGSGTLAIRDGITVASQEGYIGFHSGSSGAVTVNGSGSNWISNSNLKIGNYGDGTLNITDGGAVSNGSGAIGSFPDSTGEVTVDGSGSSWTNSGQLCIGGGGSGTLNIVDGGVVNNINKGSIGYHYNSTGKVTVDGAGSSWTNGDVLYVAFVGNGTLNINDGGEVGNTDIGYIGYLPDSTGKVTIDGFGSRWSNSSDLIVGQDGNGNLTISDGGLVSVGGTLTIDYDTDADSFINMYSGGMLALVGDADDSMLDFLDLIEGTDAIRYWDDSTSGWADITGATLGEDYTLSYLTEGDLDGYTLLTVDTAMGGDANGDGAVRHISNSRKSLGGGGLS